MVSSLPPDLHYPHSLNNFFVQPHGRAWKIHNKELLIRDVVPKYYVQSKYESFTRQIVGWGFKRLHQSGNDFNAFYHESFLRGLPHLTVLMKRVAPNQGKLLPHVEGEPNFYEIHVNYPLPYHPIPPKGHHPPSVVKGIVSPEHYPSKHPRRETIYDHGVSSTNEVGSSLPYCTFLSSHSAFVGHKTREVGADDTTQICSFCSNMENESTEIRAV